MNLSIEDHFVFSSLQSHFNKDVICLDDLMDMSVFDWNLCAESVIRNGVGPFFHKHIVPENRELFPTSVKEKFEATYFKTLSRNMILYEQFKHIITEFSKSNISVIVLKGIYLAENIYHDIGVRQLSDIDLLLKYEEIEVAGNILMELGFENLNHKLKRDFHRNKHFNFQKNGVIVELHQHIYPYTENFNVDINSYRKYAKSTTINNVNTLVLADLDLVQQLCLHLYIHLRVGKFSLISFCDIITLIKSLENKFNWDLFIKKCEQENCLTEIATILIITHKYIGKFIPTDKLGMISEDFNLYFEERFCGVFQGNNLTMDVAETKINTFKETQGFFNKIKYFFNDVFQMKEFMIHRYKPKYPKLYFLYYPVRLITRISNYVSFRK